MSKKNLQTLKGFRDFLPREKRQRDFVAGKIKETFELFGFEPLETPTLEYADLLLGKYGEEADKLVYTFEDRGERKVGLRYDQTVPTARVLAQYQNELPKMFRRYQMQNVFRADKPQKGRFREFAQCDIDIFGSTSEVADVEILACTYFAYKNIGFKNPKLVINSRNVLFNTLNSFANDKVSLNSIIQSVDKLDKITEADLVEELTKKGLLKETAMAVLAALKYADPDKNLVLILKALETYGIADEDYVFNPYIARGLDYYTGMVFEVQIPGYMSGSVGGGGRYDNLIKDLSGVDIPAVGMAFGFDRTVEAAFEAGLINEAETTAQVLVTVFNTDLLIRSIEVVKKIRTEGIKAELYPDAEAKLDKQMKYADKKQIPFVIVIGQEEVDKDIVSIKNLETGEQLKIKLEDAINKIKHSN